MKIKNLIKDLINCLSQSHSYDSNSSSWRNFYSQFWVKGLNGVLIGGATDETYSRLAAAKLHCSAEAKLPEEFSECKEKIIRRGSYFLSPFIFLDSIIQILIDHPRIISKEKSDEAIKMYSGFKSIIGGFSFYLL